MSWAAKAECRKYPDDSWFPSGSIGAQRESRPVAVKRAVAICQRCPVRADCAKDALKRDIAAGIWGGVDLGDSAAKQISPKKRAELVRVVKEAR